jgi:hypothetical protein
MQFGLKVVVLECSFSKPWSRYFGVKRIVLNLNLYVMLKIDSFVVQWECLICNMSDTLQFQTIQ